MRVLALIFGVLAAITAGALALFTLGAVAAIAVVVLVLALGIAPMFMPGIAGIATLVAGLLFVASTGYGGYAGFQIYDALTNESGPADPVDAAALASTETKVDAIEDDAGFRLELTEEEISAFLQDGLGDDTPIRNVTIDIIDASGSDPGRIAFEANFKSGSLTASGAIGYAIEAGGISVEILEIEVGALTIPGVVRGALEELINSVIDLNETLDEHGASVQVVRLANDSLLVVGTQSGGDLLTSADLLAALRDNAAQIGSASRPPAERLGAGTVNALSQPGSPAYLALGDSLAANVGVDAPRDGYVSRFHRQLEGRDSTSYGLNNLGVSGETSATLIRSGQLDLALTFIDANNVAYITLDIGANDFLGHLGSPDCSQSTGNPACTARLDASLDAYRDNLDAILRRLREAAPDATILFLQTYNPFSFGFDVIGLKAETDQVVIDLNAAAAQVAARYEVLVADGFAPLRGTAGATTHMAEAPPDIQPRPIGYDALAAALVDALP